MSLRAKAILIFTAVIILGGGVIAYVAYQAKVSKGLDIQISGPEKVLVGVPFDVKVNVVNSSDNLLDQVRLNINLPDGLAFLGSPAAKNVDFRDLGSVQPGEVSQQTISLIALNGQNTYKQITASVSYLSGSLSSRFQKESSFQLAVGDYGITLDIATPQKVFSGESFDTGITYKNSSTIDFDSLKLALEYPPTFTLSRSTLKPDVGNNTWLLGGLHKNSENTFTITGNIIGPDDATFDLKATVYATFLGQEYPININAATLSIAASPLSIKIALNGGTDYIAKADDALHYTLTYTNNTDIGLRDVIITAQLVGEMFDFSQLSSNGSFNSVNNTLTWNASNIPSLSSLSPGESGEIDFALKTKSAYPIRRLSDKNFMLKVRTTIESPTVPNFVQANKTFSLSSLETKVADQIRLATKVLFRDPNSGILNKGPFPPRVGQATQFTVHWQITNYSNDAKDITVSAFLGGNVKFTGLAKASAGAAVPTYNDRTQQVTWTIGRIPATVGVISAPLEATFQISATPSSSDVGTFMQVIQESLIKATDDFTNQGMDGATPPVTTQLPDDPTVINTPGIVSK